MHPDMVITTRADFKSQFPTLAIFDEGVYTEVMTLLKSGARGI